jgi:hypothetical protein
VSFGKDQLRLPAYRDIAQRAAIEAALPAIVY